MARRRKIPKRQAHESTRARERLRKGVEDALLALGNGFLVHPDNQALRAALQNGTLATKDYFHQLLLLVYRLIFLLTVEERELLHPISASDAAKELYARDYGMQRLCTRSVKLRAFDRLSDLWEAIKVVFRGLSTGDERIGLPALAGIFANHQCVALDAANVENQHLLTAVFRLSWLKDESGLSRVNWRDMEPEELGSVYESLLELVPQITQAGRVFGFATGGETKGHARKLTGSYYTPDSLVQVLLDSALEPVVQQTLATHPQNPAEALLQLSIVDPACGSGHFLLAAARRLGSHVARVQANGTPSAAQYRQAVRQVVQRCIYGVDLNPMAVELCKVSLWMEAALPGKPLSFLDSRIHQGNALLGATPELMSYGIPEAAWEPIDGDDKKIASALKKKNKKAAESPRGLAYNHQPFVADAWCAAFVWPKKPGEVADAAPTNDLWFQIRDGRVPDLTKKTVEDLAKQYHFFHWHLAFSHVFARGGFDVVLGNPPWERVKLQESEWFASRRPDIAMAPHAAARKALIAKVETDDPHLYAELLGASRLAEGESSFLRASGRYPLCGRGDINFYAVFSELFYHIASPNSACGLIVPSGILADETTRLFFKELQEAEALEQAIDFENNESLFPGVGHGRMRFCVLTIRKGQRIKFTRLFFLARSVSDLADRSRWFEVTPGDAAAINPNSKTCPVFLGRRDAELTKSVYRRFPVLRRESPSESPWNIRLHQVFHMTADAPFLKTAEALIAQGWSRDQRAFHRGKETMLPIIEGKMVTFYDHRASHIRLNPDAPTRQQQTAEASDIEKQNPDFFPDAYLYAPEDEAQTRFREDVRQDWAIAFKRVTSATNWRTMVACVVPETLAISYTLYLVSVEGAGRSKQHCLLAMLNSFAYDYFVRQKTMQPSLPIGPVYETVMPSPESFDEPAPWCKRVPLCDWIAPRVAELICVSNDLTSFSHATLGRESTFKWAPERRESIQAELDAMAFHHFGLSRPEVAHVLATFPKVRDYDEKAHGEYRTKRVILEIYDALADAVRTGKPYETRIDPPPADPRVAHPPDSPREKPRRVHSSSV